MCFMEYCGILCYIYIGIHKKILKFLREYKEKNAKNPILFYQSCRGTDVREGEVEQEGGEEGGKRAGAK